MIRQAVIACDKGQVLCFEVTQREGSIFWFRKQDRTIARRCEKDTDPTGAGVMVRQESSYKDRGRSIDYQVRPTKRLIDPKALGLTGKNIRANRG